MDQFDSFAEQFRRFEGLLRGVVVSTLLLATVTTVAEYRHFEPDFMAITWMVAVIGGMAGVITEYIAARPKVQSEVADVLRARPDRAARLVLVWLLGAALAIGLFYWRVVSRDHVGTVVFVGLATYLFFKGIARSLVTIEVSARQAAQWSGMSGDQRVAWITQEAEFKASRRAAVRELQEMRADSETRNREIRALTDRLKQSQQRMKRDEARRRREQVLRRLHDWTIAVRKRLGGDRLLTSSERQGIAMRELELSIGMEQLDESIRSDTVAAMRAGQLPSRTVEGTSLTLHQSGAWTYVGVPSEMTQQEANGFLTKLEPIKEDWGRVIAVLPIDGTITLEAERALETAGMTLYRDRPGPNVEVKQARRPRSPGRQRLEQNPDESRSRSSSKNAELPRIRRRASKAK